MGLLMAHEIYRDHTKEYFAAPTIEFLRNFILDKKISDKDSIVLEPSVFDELALDFRETYKEPIKLPFIFLGVWIRPAERSALHQHQALILKDEPRPLPPEPEKPKVSYGDAYRCGYCGKLVDEYGADLQGEAYNLSIARWKQYGNDIFVKTVGNCCDPRNKKDI